MATKLRSDRVQFPDGSEQTEARQTPLFAGRTNYSNVRNSYNNFPIGTKVGFWYRTGSGSTRNFNNQYKVLYEKTGNNSWSEVGGG
jgi:hypothetical protein